MDQWSTFWKHAYKDAHDQQLVAQQVKNRNSMPTKVRKKKTANKQTRCIKVRNIECKHNFVYKNKMKNSRVPLNSIVICLWLHTPYHCF